MLSVISLVKKALLIPFVNFLQRRVMGTEEQKVIIGWGWGVLHRGGHRKRCLRLVDTRQRNRGV